MIDIKYFRFVFAFIMALFMSCIIAGVLTYINLGLVEGFFKIWMQGWAKAFVVAYPCLLLLFPIVTRMANALCKQAG